MIEIKKIFFINDIVYLVTIDNVILVSGKSNYSFTKTNNENKFNYINFSSNIKKIDSGNNFLYVLTEDGNLYSSGDNFHGQLGQGNYCDYKILTAINLPFKVKDVFCGPKYVYIISDNNKLYSCGENYDGQLGLGHNANVNSFTFVNINKDYQICNVKISKNAIYIIANNEIYNCGYGNTNKFTKLNNIRYVGNSDDDLLNSNLEEFVNKEFDIIE